MRIDLDRECGDREEDGPDDDDDWKYWRMDDVDRTMACLGTVIPTAEVFESLFGLRS